MFKIWQKISFFAVIFLMFVITITTAAADNYPGFKVEGRHLYDKNGEKVVLYGVNEMSVWGDIDGDVAFPEIRKTGANSVRIVWSITAPARKLDLVIYNCIENNMIPMIELHDATGEWDKLPDLVDYWVSPEVVEVIQKYEEYLLVNIGNEVGQQVSESDFRQDYETAVNRMREAGIHTPLVIDASSYGQDIDMLQSAGPYLIDSDPDHNLMFSVHMWWPYSWGYDEQTVIDEIAESVNMELPLIVGEFGNQWEENENGQIPYKTILEQCYLNEIGYLAWSWGPGNDPQAFLDMTEDGTFDTLHDWGEVVALTDTYSIKNISVRPEFMLEEPNVELPINEAPEGNIAQNKPVTVSSEETDLGNVAENAVDGNLGTRWSSDYSDPQYIYVDLEDTYRINRVYIEWETAYASEYLIQVSDDASTWTDVYTEYDSDGDIDDINFDPVDARYVRVYCVRRATEWGNSIFELGVYSEGNDDSEDDDEGSDENENPAFQLGDVNGDEFIDSLDYSLMRRYIIGEDESINNDSADIDKDGYITSLDYSLLGRYVKGEISDFDN